ncbi:MAG TPA: putative glycoside hydrolase [Gaiellaceae bacterium]|nr:putative glycoside hydrolase [Gaiellaceae bacterium]
MAVVSDLDHAELRRQRRDRRRRQVRRRRLTALAALVVLAAAALFGLARLVSGAAAGATSSFLQPVAAALPQTPFRTPTPEEIRGVHVTGPLMSLPGRFAKYLALTKQGLNTVEVDLKDESGNVSFVRGAPALARADGAARDYFDPAKVARQAHAAGVYLIGRVVTFQDPITATAHPELAIHRADGSVWKTSGGLAWLNPYNRQAWKYDVDVAVRAAKAGFDEIQFDYVRFPSDGDLSLIRYPGAHPQPMRATVPAFLRYARSRLHPLGVRISADVFGLSAAHDLGIGQLPAQIGRIVDAIYPMTYPSHYTPGEYNLPNPNAAPGATVLFSLQDFRNRLPLGGATLVPWLQDFSLYRTYTPRDVAAQIQAARSLHTGGFMLWNAAGIYTAKELHPAARPAPLPVLPAPQL